MATKRPKPTPQKRNIPPPKNPRLRSSNRPEKRVPNKTASPAQPDAVKVRRVGSSNCAKCGFVGAKSNGHRVHKCVTTYECKFCIKEFSTEELRDKHADENHAELKSLVGVEAEQGPVDKPVDQSVKRKRKIRKLPRSCEYNLFISFSFLTNPETDLASLKCSVCMVV